MTGEFRRVDKFVTRAGQAGARACQVGARARASKSPTRGLARRRRIELTSRVSRTFPSARRTARRRRRRASIDRSVRLDRSSFCCHGNDDESHHRSVRPALELSDMKEKLSSPVRNARNVVVRATLSEQFAVAFREHVEKYPLHRVDRPMHGVYVERETRSIVRGYSQLPA